MQCDDVEIGLCATSRLNELDSALRELGMLVTLSDTGQDYATRNTRQDFSKEVQHKHLYHMFNEHKYRNFKLRLPAPHVRYKPYSNSTSKQKERHRTRSENSDCEINIKGLLDEVTEKAIPDEVAQLKKAKSLESIIVEGTKDVDFNSINIPEVQVVSDLEKLKVGE